MQPPTRFRLGEGILGYIAIGLVRLAITNDTKVVKADDFTNNSTTKSYY